MVAGLRYLKTNFGSPGWMGNEASSVRIHSALTAEDLKGLRHGFPGGGNGPPPARLHFGPWNTCWRPEDRAQLERMLIEKTKKGAAAAAAAAASAAASKDSEDGISFYAYQDLAGSVVRGTTEARVKLLFRMLDRSPDKAVPSNDLIGFVSRVAQTAGRIIRKKEDGEDEGSIVASDALAKALVHELVFPGETAKSCFLKE